MSKATQRAAWMRRFQDTCLALGHEPGRIHWNTAAFYYLSGKQAEAAAFEHMGNRLRQQASEVRP